jgi:hypothetical protein
LVRYDGITDVRSAISQRMQIGKQEDSVGRLEHVNAFSYGNATVLEFNTLRPKIIRVHAGSLCTR